MNSEDRKNSPRFEEGNIWTWVWKERGVNYNYLRLEDNYQETSGVTKATQKPAAIPTVRPQIPTRLTALPLADCAAVILRSDPILLIYLPIRQAHKTVDGTMTVMMVR